jgi:uncharacterized membrane protein YjfL (UPF0719 family)
LDRWDLRWDLEGENSMMLENMITGIIQLIIAIILSVVALYIGFSVFARITTKIDEEEELAKGNAAVGIVVASVFISIAIVIQSGIAGVSMGIKSAIAGNMYPLIASIIQLVLGVILAIGAIYLALNVLDRMTKEIDEFAEIKKGNVAVALEMAGVIIAVSIIIQSGVLGITSSL